MNYIIEIWHDAPCKALRGMSYQFACKACRSPMRLIRRDLLGALAEEKSLRLSISFYEIQSDY